MSMLSTLPLIEVKYVRFSLYDEEEIRKLSAGAVLSNEQFKIAKPVPGGIYDTSMGTTSTSYNCTSCLYDSSKCLGHQGHLELNYPTMNSIMIVEIKKWLKIICYHCGSLVVPIKKSVRPSKILSELIKNVRGVKVCPSCKLQHMQVVKDKKRPCVFYRIQEEGKVIVKKEEFFNHDIEKVLQKIKDETVLFLGKPLRSHPSKFIIRNIHFF